MIAFLVCLVFGSIVSILCVYALSIAKALQAENASLKNMVAQLELLATHDPLTGLLNRRGGDEVLDHHYSILSRDNCEKNNFAILCLDLDRFKGINDTHGHEIGDSVLKFFGKLLTKNLRSHGHDVVIRVGGDEFVIFLPECNLEHAEVVKTKIKEALLAEHFEEDGVALSLRTSVGIATARQENEVLPLAQIFKLADIAMYEDKAKGRNLRNSGREFH